MIEGLAHLLFPKVCIVCRKPLEPDEEHLCSACFVRFEPFPDPSAGTQALFRTVREHFGEPVVPSSAWALYPYTGKGALHDALHALKYGGIYPLGALFGRRIGELVRSQGGEEAIDAIVPVPLHPLKRIERTYNQAEEIAAGIASVLDRPLLPHAVERSVYTLSQTGMSIRERRRNMDSAFRPGRTPCKGRVLLVDDVLTTGATLVAAAGALHASGAGSVGFAVIAITEKE